jgi:hypothetical protein
MFLRSLPEIDAYIAHINANLISQTGQGLTRIQKNMFSLVIVGVYVTGTLCWAAFERVDCFGLVSQDRLRSFFRYAEIPWNILLSISVKTLLQKYGEKEGVLVIDDSDNSRSKNTRKIYGAHKIKDKKSGGYINGQAIVFLVLVTPTITLPVGVSFFIPDPDLKKWMENDKKLRKEGVLAADRPKKPERNLAFPSVSSLAILLIKEFMGLSLGITVKAVLADALYGNKGFLKQASGIYGIPQVVSQLKRTQKVLSAGRWVSLENIFPGSLVYVNQLRSEAGKPRW